MKKLLLCILTCATLSCSKQEGKSFPKPEQDLELSVTFTSIDGKQATYVAEKD